MIGYGHPEWSEDALLQKVSVELACDLVQYDSERQKAQIAVAPTGAGRVGQRDALDNFEQFRLGVIFPHVEILRVIGEPGGMTQQFANCDLLPGGGRSGKYSVSGSSRPILPSSTSIMTAVAVNCAHRAIEDGFGLHRNLQLQVRHAVALRADDLPTARDQRQSEYVASSFPCKHSSTASL
jgi:hypothetical protein